MLGYSSTVKGVQQHVNERFTVKLSDVHDTNEGCAVGRQGLISTDPSIHLTEQSLYQFIFKS